MCGTADGQAPVLQPACAIAEAAGSEEVPADAGLCSPYLPCEISTSLFALLYFLPHFPCAIAPPCRPPCSPLSLSPRMQGRGPALAFAGPGLTLIPSLSSTLSPPPTYPSTPLGPSFSPPCPFYRPPPPPPPGLFSTTRSSFHMVVCNAFGFAQQHTDLAWALPLKCKANL